MSSQQGLQLDKERTTGHIECLGRTFSSEHERREYFREELRNKLRDPEFRQTPGFPDASDEDILRLSDPPFYTACPNPFLEDFVRVHGEPYEPNEQYDREPFSVDVSEGKRNQLYQGHGYHTKVPHLAIAPSILHYTKPGELVLDGFAGSGMTGLAAQWCGTAPKDYRRQVESEWKAAGLRTPEWGPRRAIVNDLSPAASFIAAGYNLPFDLDRFEQAAYTLLNELDEELGWMYETPHEDGEKGRINYTVWSEVFSCPECAGEVNFIEEALDDKTNKTLSEFPCPHCGTELTKKRLERFYVTRYDPVSGESHQVPKRVPVLVNYNVGSATHERPPTAEDLSMIDKVAKLPLPPEVPATRLPYMHMTHERARMDVVGVTHLHHFFLPRAAHALSALWRKANAEEDTDTRRMLLWFVEQAIWGMSVLNRYSPTHFSQVNRALNGVYYIASQHSEVSPWYILHDEERRTTKLSRLTSAFSPMPSVQSCAAIQTGDCASLGLPDQCIDYVFTDPPFGENIYYADLNFLVESWHGVLTAPEREAIVDQAKNKQVHEYQDLMRQCFEEYFRVLKPGRWMTVVFSNSSNAIWRAIQEAMGTAGFVVADVRTLDKKHGSYRQVTSSAVKQDLIISSYKPTAALEKSFELSHAGAESAWAFVKEHLRNVPVFVGDTDGVEIVAERTPQMLLDRMIAFHVQRGVSVPVSGPEFRQGLAQRFPERDGMYFLPDQVAQYDRKRTTAAELRQLDLFVVDEASAIQWVRQQLHTKPRSFQELQPQYMPETRGWLQHEKQPELKDILNENFLHYNGSGPVPSQIHAYLSSNFKHLRNMEKDEPPLQEKAKDRWYVPDPNKQADLEQLRERALRKEFEEYKASSQRKLKLFRTEAVRVGFKDAWQERDYGTIVEVSEKLPPDVLQEDPTLLMYYDNALTRLGE